MGTSAGAPRGDMGILYCQDEPERPSGWQGHGASAGPQSARSDVSSAPGVGGGACAPGVHPQQPAGQQMTATPAHGGYYSTPQPPGQPTFPGPGSMYGVGNPYAGGAAPAPAGTQAGYPGAQMTMPGYAQVAQLQQPAQQQDIVLVWDWDDTLMCSSAINANKLAPHQPPQLDALLEQVLSLSMQLGDTYIVTNADELWVMESTRRFTPRILPMLQTGEIKVISARRRWESRCPGDVFAWKRETFREVLSARAPRASGLNLIVLGDSPAEMEAAQTSVLGLPHQVTIKTVKFKETPTCDDLLEQLRISLQELSTIVADDKSCSRNLVNWMAVRPQAAQYPMGAYTAAQSFVAAPPVANGQLVWSGWSSAQAPAPATPGMTSAGLYLGSTPAAVYAGGMR